MPRPTNKKELVELSQQNYQKLIGFIDSLPKDELKKDFPPGTMNRNIRDILAHLHHWHTMLIGWYTIGLTGTKPEMPAKGYTWKTTPELNHKIWKMYRKTSYIKARNLFEKSHAEVLAIINIHTNTELFEKKRYKWTGSTSMGAYFVSATSSHYDWALNLLKKATK